MPQVSAQLSLLTRRYSLITFVLKFIVILRWIGHILRHDSLLRDIIEGRMKGKVTRGRKRLQMLSDVISKSYEELKREVEDRSWWKKRAS